MLKQERIQEKQIKMKTFIQEKKITVKIKQNKKSSKGKPLTHKFCSGFRGRFKRNVLDNRNQYSGDQLIAQQNSQ